MANLLSILAHVKRQNGAAIRAIRKAQNIKLTHLAQRVGVNAGFLCHVEAERCYASQQTIDRLAKELAVPVKAITRNPE